MTHTIMVAREVATKPRIREVREALGWTQAELARRMGISGAQMNRLEHAERGLKLPVLVALSLAMNCEVTDLFTYTVS